MNQIAYQMNEFQSSVGSIEQKFDLINKTVRETLSDLNLGFEFLNQSILHHKNSNNEDINDFKEKIKEIVINECESMKNVLKELVEITYNCKDFQEKELIIRKKMNEDPEHFEEKMLKELIQSKSSNKQINNQKYLEVVEMIENAKQGNLTGSDDIVMDTQTTQVTKCPITGKPIEDGVKNTTCDHMYERSAILHYIKTNRHKKCPFAGCKQHVTIR